jgi:hypothetical protein
VSKYDIEFYKERHVQHVRKIKLYKNELRKLQKAYNLNLRVIEFQSKGLIDFRNELMRIRNGKN